MLERTQRLQAVRHNCVHSFGMPAMFRRRPVDEGICINWMQVRCYIRCVTDYNIDSLSENINPEHAVSKLYSKMQAISVSFSQFLLKTMAIYMQACRRRDWCNLIINKLWYYTYIRNCDCTIHYRNCCVLFDKPDEFRTHTWQVCIAS